MPSVAAYLSAHVISAIRRVFRDAQGVKEPLNL